ncbi:hypothetical protein BC832DRAFT_473673 [Gaertneriomyces semiglobifer]|nr:hypothetical protein BC832DRAFT_473673 [Gaertneriomyces semiglobifer]
MDDAPAAKLIRQKAEEWNIRGLSLLHSPDPTPSDLHLSLTCFSKAIYLCSTEPSYYLHRADTYLVLNNLDEAIVNYRHVCYLTQKESYEVFRIPNPYDPVGSPWVCRMRLAPVIFMLGKQMVERGQHEEALTTFDWCARLGFPEDEILPCSTPSLLALDKQHEALSALCRLSETQPGNVELIIERARIYRNMNNVPLVNLEYNKIKAMEPHHSALQDMQLFIVNHATMLKNRASTLIQKEELVPALGCLSESLELDPDWITYLKRGLLLIEFAQYDGAIQDFETVLGLDTRDVSRDKEVKSYIADCHQCMGRVAYDGGEYHDAMYHFTKALEWDEEDIENWRCRGETYLTLGELDKALEDFSNLVRRDAEDTPARQRCAFLLAHASRVPTLEQLTKALEYDPVSAEIYLKRAQVYLQQQDFDAARTDLEQALKIDPAYIEAKAMLTLIESGPVSDPNVLAFKPQRKIKQTTPYVATRNANGGIQMKPIDRAPPLTRPNMMPRQTRPDSGCSAGTPVAESRHRVLSLPPLALPKLTVLEGGPREKPSLPDRIQKLEAAQPRKMGVSGNLNPSGRRVHSLSLELQI